MVVEDNGGGKSVILCVFLMDYIMTKNEWKGHAGMLGAEVMWGLMAPISKVVLVSGITPWVMTNCRMLGAACLFWLASLFTRREHVSPNDLLMLFFAALLGIIFNQGTYMFGLNLTSPVNASIITTSLPILTMVIAALVLREPVTRMKLSGVFLGAIGAFVLIVSGSSGEGRTSNVWGDVLCLLAQLSFSFYLVCFKGLISRYSPVTIMKWMFTYASICLIPFSYNDLLAVEWDMLDSKTLGGLAMVVFCATFISYLLIPLGQKYLRPTVTSMYNYVQPIIASIVAICWGMDRFNVLKIVAVALVFTGVFFVTKSPSRADLEAGKKA